MPNFYTLTADLDDLIGGEALQVGDIRLESNIGSDALVDQTNKKIRLGGSIAVGRGAGNTISVAGIIGSDSTDVNVDPGTLQYQLRVDYWESRGRKTWTSGWFYLTATANLADLATEATPTVVQTGADIIAQMQGVLADVEEAAAGALAPTDEAVADLIDTPSSATAGKLSTTFVSGSKLGGLVAPPLVDVDTPAIGTTPKAVDVFDGYTWGFDGAGDIYRSANDGATWTLYDATYPGLTLNRLIPTDDGEVLACSSDGVFKSTNWATSPTWTKKVTPNGTCQMYPWGLAGNGTKFISTEYSATRADSRYVRVSLDGGNTWSVAYDSVTVHGATLANGSHLHGCEYDTYADRFYFTEGHDDGGSAGAIAGIYCSEDDGATWSRAAGMAQNPGPTTITAHPDGLVCGSDNSAPGLYGVIRRDNPADEALVQTWRWRTGRDGVAGFARRGYVEPETGIVYVGFATHFADVAPVIAAGTPTSGSLVYSYSGTFVANDYIRNVVLPRRGRLLSSVRANGSDYLLTAATGKPGAQDATVADTGAVLGGGPATATSVAAGKGSVAGGIRKVAVGVTASAGSSDSSQDNVAVGYAATTSSATASFIAVIGASAWSATQGVSVGYQAGLSGAASVGNTSVGYQAKVLGGGSGVAVGQSASAAGTSVAVGASSVVNSGRSGAVAVGYQASAQHTGSVALGSTSTTTADNQVAVGARFLTMGNIAVAPTTPGLYVEAGALKYRGSSGTVTTLGAA